MADFADAPWLVGDAQRTFHGTNKAGRRARKSERNWGTIASNDPTAWPWRATSVRRRTKGPDSEVRTHRASHAGSALRFNEVALDWSHLEQHRIIGHNVADPRSKVFDVLRTQVLQAMDQKNWQFLAITSPTEGCGKTVTAINLALSIARQPERSALLIDMDLQRPTVANYLGIKVPAGRAGYPRGASNARGR